MRARDSFNKLRLPQSRRAVHIRGIATSNRNSLVDNGLGAFGRPNNERLREVREGTFNLKAVVEPSQKRRRRRPVGVIFPSRPFPRACLLSRSIIRPVRIFRDVDSAGSAGCYGHDRSGRLSSWDRRDAVCVRSR